VADRRDTAVRQGPGPAGSRRLPAATSGKDEPIGRRC
jgi:hypothetical protein